MRWTREHVRGSLYGIDEEHIVSSKTVGVHEEFSYTSVIRCSTLKKIIIIFSYTLLKSDLIGYYMTTTVGSRRYLMVWLHRAMTGRENKKEEKKEKKI